MNFRQRHNDLLPESIFYFAFLLFSRSGFCFDLPVVSLSLKGEVLMG
jgi:hypothetical protein